MEQGGKDRTGRDTSPGNRLWSPGPTGCSISHDDIIETSNGGMGLEHLPPQYSFHTEFPPFYFPYPVYHLVIPKAYSLVTLPEQL